MLDPQFEKHISASPRTSASYCGANDSLQNWTCGSLGAGVGAIRWDFGQWNPMTSHFWMVYTHPFMVILGMVSCVIVSDILTLFHVYLCSINIFHNLIRFPTFCHITRAYLIPLGFRQAMRRCGDPLGFLDVEFLSADMPMESDVSEKSKNPIALFCRYDLGWWFGTFFPYIGNHHPNWLSYFSEG